MTTTATKRRREMLAWLALDALGSDEAGEIIAARQLLRRRLERGLKEEDRPKLHLVPTGKEG